MARAKRAATPAIKPAKTPRTRKAKAAPPADTREGLIAEMATILDAVDQALPTMTHIEWASAYYGTLAKHKEAVNALFTRMHKLLGEDAEESADDVFKAALSAPPGEVPTPARPGRFVAWLGYVPVLLEWGGFITRDAELYAVDPKELWLTDTGRLTVGAYIQRGELDLRKWFEQRLQATAANPKFRLHTLKTGQTAALERLATNTWLREVIAKGPVDPVPLPKHLAAIQLEPFI